MAADAGQMTVLALRLHPGDDLKLGIEAAFAETGAGAGCIVAAVGSLSRAVVRPAGREDGITFEGDMELVALDGTLSPDGAHLHLAVSDAEGRVTGGHLLPGSVVRTTAELVLGLIAGITFAREIDPATGFRELTIT